MKKPIFYLGEFTQRDKVFITAENGVDVENVLAVAFEGETLYIAQPEGVIEYADGKTKLLPIKASNLFSRKGKLYAAVGNSLAEIKKGKVKKIHDFDSPVVDISIALDGSFWLITEDALYRLDDEFVKIMDVAEQTICLAALDNKAKYAETVFVGSTVEGLLSMKGKRRHWAELLPDITGVLSKKINCIALDALGHLWV